MLLGNKSDLINDKKVDTNKAKKYAYSNGMSFFEVSAKKGTNVTECFNDLTSNIINELQFWKNNHSSTHNKLETNDKFYCCTLL